ncbi:hypothetical protein RJ640_016906 [Escallonia rubra]|uniref:Uncharacterized protein n=1 Tax=Escallonia rubra TaxID=112253 RepID=A0AA88U888_9ASTE|nr:hypothetical protein RJ640_016906 [Escallonia rubra]
MVASLKTVSLKQPAGDPSTAKTPPFSLLLVSLLGGIFCFFPKFGIPLLRPFHAEVAAARPPLSPATTISSGHRCHTYKAKINYVALLLLVTTFAMSHAPVRVLGEPVDYLLLVLQWPYSVCNVKGDRPCFDPVPDDFKIHGFYPHYKDGTSATDCPAVPIGKSLDSIKYQLLQKWPTLFVNNPEEDLLKASQKFWRRQWEKHGSCSNLSPFDYFSMALKFRGQLNPLEVLRREGVEPSGRSFTAKELQDAMPFTPKVKCNKKDEMPQLKEVQFCVKNPVGACMQSKRLPEERISRNKDVNISPRVAKWRPYRGKGNAIVVNLGTI